MVKLEMVFYKTGYTRIPRVVSITGAYKHWDNNAQSFISPPQRIPQKEPTAARPQRQVHVRRRAMGKRESQLLCTAMSRLPQIQDRGEREKGSQGADRPPTHQCPHRILRKPRKIQERQTSQRTLLLPVCIYSFALTSLFPVFIVAAW